MNSIRLEMSRGLRLCRLAPKNGLRRASMRSFSSVRSAATRRFLMATGPTAAVIYSMFRTKAFCAGGEEPPETSGEGNDPVSDLIDQYGPVGGQITFGYFCGVISGYALKRIGMRVALALGSLFLVAQAFSYLGYIDIKWNKVQQSVVARLDMDDDGKITTSDLKVYWQKFKEIMSYNLPAGGGYSAGVATGLVFM